MDYSPWGRKKLDTMERLFHFQTSRNPECGGKKRQHYSPERRDYRQGGGERLYASGSRSDEGPGGIQPRKGLLGGYLEEDPKLGILPLYILMVPVFCQMISV